ncbi:MULTISPECIES: hypothetical protein [Campylobacter]|uniref:hypothetical protein n=1 Tax=Campylobacter TaxID=194 RepID=UPI000A343597|nr:hypothetical protein [Campylobacter sp. RM9262]MCR8701022.1 hypothetical protein [Campylobacter sp. RM12176]
MIIQSYNYKNVGITYFHSDWLQRISKMMRENLPIDFKIPSHGVQRVGKEFQRELFIESYEYQLHFWAICFRQILSDSYLDHIFPVLFYNYPIEAGRNYVLAEAKDIEDMSNKTLDAAQHKAHELIEELSLSKGIVLNDYQIKLIPMCSMHRHPYSTGVQMIYTIEQEPTGFLKDKFSAEDKRKGPNTTGIVYPIKEPAIPEQPSYSCIIKEDFQGNKEIAYIACGEYNLVSKKGDDVEYSLENSYTVVLRDDTDITDITSAMKLCGIKSKKKTYIVSDRKEIDKGMLMVDSLSFTPEFNIDSNLTKVKL